MSVIEHNPRRLRRSFRRRRGITVVGGLICAVALIGLTALALDISQLAYRHEQIQAACDSSCLAGTALLMDRSVLFPDLNRSATAENLHLIRDAQIDEARRAAQHFAAENRVLGEPLRLKANVENRPDGDMVVGWVEEPTALGAKMADWQEFGPVNSMVVQVIENERRGNPVALWIARAIGAGAVDSEVRARATVMQQVYGFRPTELNNAPLVPILALPEGHRGWLRQASRSTEDGQNDRFRVSEPAGEIERGPDGIPEITLRLSPTGSQSEEHRTENAWLLPRTGGAGVADPLARQIAFGLGPEDLAGLGGELALGGDGQLLLGPPQLAGPGGLERLGQSLLAIRGQKRIWPLGLPAGGGMSVVVGFGAARVVNCELTDEGELEIVVQPCLIQTGTALVRAGQSLNPWIGKLALTR